MAQLIDPNNNNIIEQLGLDPNQIRLVESHNKITFKLKKNCFHQLFGVIEEFYNYNKVADDINNLQQLITDSNPMLNEIDIGEISMNDIKLIQQNVKESLQEKGIADGVGILGGAAVGAMIAGPVGAVIGGFIGLIFGEGYGRIVVNKDSLKKINEIEGNGIFGQQEEVFSLVGMEYGRIELHNIYSNLRNANHPDRYTTENMKIRGRRKLFELQFAYKFILKAKGWED